MSKKITFGIIGLVGLGFFLLIPATHAAVAAPQAGIDQSTRILLGQTLNVLRVVLNQIDARLNGAGDPIENPQAVNSALGGIKTILLSIDAQLAAAPAAAAPEKTAITASPVGSLEGNGAEVDVGGSKAQTATVSWFLGPRILLILLPLAILLLIMFSLRKRGKLEEKKETLSVEPTPLEPDPVSPPDPAPFS